MLRGVGFEVQDLGINVSTDEFVQKVAQYRPDILGLSALLTTTMQEMRKVIEALKSTGLQKDVRVMVGGAPVNQKFANDIGADAYAQNAGEAISITRRLLAEKT
jgi:5-methyltetrahydrofolate--homocysteine methyltransferase